MVGVNSSHSLTNENKSLFALLLQDLSVFSQVKNLVSEIDDRLSDITYDGDFFLHVAGVILKYRALARSQGGEQLVRSFDSEVFARHKEFLNKSEFVQVIFFSSPEQEVFFIKEMLCRTMSHAVGNVDTQTVRKLASLQRACDSFPSLSENLLATLPVGIQRVAGSGRHQLAAGFSRYIFKLIADDIGDEQAARAFAECFDFLAKFYLPLTSFAVLVDLLPSSLLNDARLAQLDQNQIKRALLAKTYELERVSAKVSDAQSRLDLQQQMLATASRNSTLGSVAAGVTHDINNPLAIIKGKCQLVQMKLERSIEFGNEDLNQFVDSVIDCCEKITTITRGLKNFMRVEKDQAVETIGVHQFIEESLVLCRSPLQKSDVKVNLEFAESDIQVNCCRGQMIQVICSLLLNVRDALVGIGGWINLKTIKMDKKVCIEMEDSGDGIAENLRAKIFDPFFTTKPAEKNLGMGLSIAKEIVESHSGKLYLDGRAANTKFVIELPVVQPKVTAA